MSALSELKVGYSNSFNRFHFISSNLSHRQSMRKS